MYIFKKEEKEEVQPPFFGGVLYLTNNKFCTMGTFDDGRGGVCVCVCVAEHKRARTVWEEDL